MTISPHILCSFLLSDFSAYKLLRMYCKICCCRFYDVNEGSITLDGMDLQSLDPSWLRKRALGLISQEPILFGTSVIENIRYGKPGATDEEVGIFLLIFNNIGNILSL